MFLASLSSAHTRIHTFTREILLGFERYLKKVGLLKAFSIVSIYYSNDNSIKHGLSHYNSDHCFLVQKLTD